MTKSDITPINPTEKFTIGKKQYNLLATNGFIIEVEASLGVGLLTIAQGLSSTTLQQMGKIIALGIKAGSNDDTPEDDDIYTAIRSNGMIPTMQIIANLLTLSVSDPKNQEKKSGKKKESQ